MIHRFTILTSDLSDEAFDQIAGKSPDTLSGVGQGQAYVDFARESDSLGTAIDSAIADLNAVGVAVIGVQVAELAAGQTTTF